MIRRTPRSTQELSSAASDVYKRQPQSFSWETLTNKQQLLLLEAGSVSSLLQQSRNGAARRQKCKVPIAEDTHWYQRSSLPSLSQDRIQCCLIHLLPRILSFCDSCLSRAFHFIFCLLYTSDAADDNSCVDLGGRRIIKKIFFFKQKTAYEINSRLVGSEMCIRDSSYVCQYTPVCKSIALTSARTLKIL